MYNKWQRYILVLFFKTEVKYDKHLTYKIGKKINITEKKNRQLGRCYNTKHNL